MDEKIRKLYESVAKEIVIDCAKLLSKKATDYGNSNFITAAQIASIVVNKEITPVDVAACVLGIKLSRYGELYQRPESDIVNESIRDTVMDAINYIALMERERLKYEDSKNQGRKIEGTSQS